MKSAKRQIVLGALILSLGAAVYLNWQFTDVTAKNGDDTTQVDNPQVYQGEDEYDENLGVAQLVNNSYVETVKDTIPTAKDALADARLQRQQTRDEALEILSDILEDEETDALSKKTAVDESAKIAQDMVKESTAENLIKAKGVEDVVVFINEDKCSVVVQGLDGNMLLIQEIIINQCEVALENIQVIDAK